MGTKYLDIEERNMKFYSVQIKDYVEVDEKDVTIVTMKNGRKAAKASVEKDGLTLNLFRILKTEEANKLA